jgi:hypothetical protein
MARLKRGKVSTSKTPPQLFAGLRKNSTETNYLGLIRDKALVDLTERDKALDSVLKSVQDPAEASTLGTFEVNDLQILDAIVTSGLKREDFEILKNASIKGEVIEEGEEEGVLTALINPRQRISDRIKQFEGFAGRGTVYQGQGPVLFKYAPPDKIISNVSTTSASTLITVDSTAGIEPGFLISGNVNIPENTTVVSVESLTALTMSNAATQSQNAVKTEFLTAYNHKNPPPFYTSSIQSTAINSPDYIPQTPQQIETTHRVGFIQDGQFIPTQEQEWWWNGEYQHDFRQRPEYRDETRTALTDPIYPIVRDGNIKFSDIIPQGINSQYNWGLRFDAWFRHDDLGSTSNFMRWAVQVYGQIRIDYFERTGYNETTGGVEGQWITALDTTNTNTYYLQTLKEQPTSTFIGSRVHYIQGGPSMPLGGGNGTLPAQRTPEQGGALDLNAEFFDREGDPRSKFNNDYVPVIIRFWYGKPDPTDPNPATFGPAGQASFAIDMIDTNLEAIGLSKWNDYSAEIRFEYNSGSDSWAADGVEATLENFTGPFEIVAHGFIGSNEKPSPTQFIFPEGNPIIATKINNEGIITARFSIPGISPAGGDRIWVIAKNRPWIVLPENASRRREELWQRYLFHPNPIGTYKTSQDLIEGVGQNYSEPDPLFTTFEENPNYYKAKYAALPRINTYGPERYDGMLRNSITTSSLSRDYDYSHNKLLLIGRQKKDESIKPLAAEEVRKNGENYTFIEVVKNKAGRGGNVKINAYPTNNLSVLSTPVDDAQVGKFLHMADNIRTFTNPSKQNVPGFDPFLIPNAGQLGGAIRLRYEDYGTNGVRFVLGSGAPFNPDSTGLITDLELSSNVAFIDKFIKENGSEYYFYGLISVQREIKEGESVTVSGNTITSDILFNNGGQASNDKQYLGTKIEIAGNTYRVVTYDPGFHRVTLSSSIANGTYNNVKITYNHLSINRPLPTAVVDENSTRFVRESVLPDNSLIQISLVFNGAYQFSRVDNGAGISFGEILFSKAGNSPTPSAPFALGSELPAPPADIVVPFGYDNSPASDNPGLSGLCYPPYSIQAPLLQDIAVLDSVLYAAPVGNFDVWWGSKQNVSDLGGKSLTVTNRLLFDFDKNDRGGLLEQLPISQRPAFTGSEYTHKLEVELNVEVPSSLFDLSANPFLYEDAKVHSNNSSVKDKYYIFINNVGQSLEVLSPTNPSW